MCMSTCVCVHACPPHFLHQSRRRSRGLISSHLITEEQATARRGEAYGTGLCRLHMPHMPHADHPAVPGAVTPEHQLSPLWPWGCGSQNAIHLGLELLSVLLMWTQVQRCNDLNQRW